LSYVGIAQSQIHARICFRSFILLGYNLGYNQAVVYSLAALPDYFVMVYITVYGENKL